MRDTSSTVGQEMDLARAYLDIVRIRLGRRLAFEIQAPPHIRDVRMPPMMLLPLIDHAIVAGLEPSTATGTISIHTKVIDGRLRLAIADSGAAFVPEVGGDGIDSIRERLAALFGENARLDLRRAEAQATEAVLEIPLETATPSAPETSTPTMASIPR
jgi:LytS/YehU family sensor histidine kinase